MADTFLRQWAMLRMIPRAPRKIDTATIEHRLEEDGFAVNRRTIQRDLVSLSTVFPLACDDREKPFGWSWGKDAAVFDLPGMDPQTAVTFALVSQFLKPQLPRSTLRCMEPHFMRARNILDAVSPTRLRKWPDKVRVLPNGLALQAADIRPAVLNTVYEALLHEQRIQVSYLPRDTESPKEYEVNPLGLVFRNAVVYLVCTLWDYEDIKQLVLHRMRSAELLDKKRKMPRGFDLDSYIHSGEFGYPTGERTIRLKALFDPEAARHLYETPISTDQKLTPRKDGRVLVQATVEDSGELRWWLWGFGGQVEVVGPAGLRGEFAGAVRGLVGRYGGRG